MIYLGSDNTLQSSKISFHNLPANFTSHYVSYHIIIITTPHVCNPVPLGKPPSEGEDIPARFPQCCLATLTSAVTPSAKASSPAPRVDKGKAREVIPESPFMTEEILSPGADAAAQRQREELAAMDSS